MLGPADGVDDVGGDCLNQFVIGEDTAEDVVIPPISSLQLVHRTLGARWPPVRPNHDVHAFCLRSCDVCGVAIEQQV